MGDQMNFETRIDPRPTIAICTHDRLQDVVNCLAALMPQAIGQNLPVLVVDSGSPQPVADKLRAVAEVAGARYIRVEEPGVSLARNVALAACETEWLVYLDDDAVPHPTWAGALRHSLETADLDVAVIGGRILPRWPEGAETKHIGSRWMLLLSCVYPDDAGDVAEGYNICGANFAVRKSLCDDIGGFPEDLGRMGLRLISGEESYLIERLKDAGFRSLYDPAFTIDHCISAHRLTVPWVRGRAYWEGASRVKVMTALGRPISKDMRLGKLGASLPVLYGLAVLRRDPSFYIRYEQARGALAEQLSEIRNRLWGEPAKAAA